MQRYIDLNCQTIQLHSSSSMSEKEIPKHNKSKQLKASLIGVNTKEKQTVTTGTRL